MIKRREFQLDFFILIAGLFLLSCQPESTPASITTSPQPNLEVTRPTAEAAVTLTATVAAAITPAITPTQEAVTYPATNSPLAEPRECKAPLSDYTILHIKGWLLNRRTYTMLQYAAQLYQATCGANPCPIDITEKAITQGSYNDSVPESFGTHAGGGAVDISVISQTSPRFTILYDEIDPLIHALRLAGFAAWFRDLGEVGPGSPLHIHAIAIGDEHLSSAARDQLDGPFGYFRGFNGLPNDKGIPQLDPHGGPLICSWMTAAGYSDLR